MREQLLNLQSQVDTLRLQMRNHNRFGQFQEALEVQAQLHHLEGLFNRLVASEGLSLNRFGRLV